MVEADREVGSGFPRPARLPIHDIDVSLEIGPDRKLEGDGIVVTPVVESLERVLIDALPEGRHIMPQPQAGDDALEEERLEEGVDEPGMPRIDEQFATDLRRIHARQSVDGR